MQLQEPVTSNDASVHSAGGDLQEAGMSNANSHHGAVAGRPQQQQLRNRITDMRGSASSITNNSAPAGVLEAEVRLRRACPLQRLLLGLGRQPRSAQQGPLLATSPACV